jgi:uncharacterized protein (DUF2141 family)
MSKLIKGKGKRLILSAKKLELTKAMAWTAAFIFILFSMSFSENNQTLTLDIKGISGKKGNIHVGIYRKKDRFPETNGTFKNKIVSAEQQEIAITLPKDTYAIAVFWDENKNGKMDKNMFGVPTEKYGFSNNARGTFSAPSFEEASFQLQNDRKLSITIK